MAREFEQTRGLMRQAAHEGVFPGAVLLVAQGGEVVLHEAYGHRQLLPEPLPATLGTVYDLASLTKPLATALALGALVAEGRLSFETPLGEFLPAPPEKAEITLGDLASHSSGLPAWRPYCQRLLSAPASERRALLTGLVLEEPLETLPGEVARYSDPGYILLGAAVERAAGERLDRLASGRLYLPLGLALHFRPLDCGNSERPGGNADGVPAPQDRLQLTPRSQGGGDEPVVAHHPEAEIAATEACPLRGKVLLGEVHDESCWAAGGVCGHAGLFGTALDVARLLLHLRRAVKGEAEGVIPAAVLRKLFERQRQPRGTTWGLGFDHPNRVGSSAGRLFSRRSVGHLAFTGCSFWLDLEHDLAVVLLSNRVHPTRDNEAIKVFRPRLHEAAFREAIG